MPGLYRTIRDDILTVWNANWAVHADVPAFWRSDDLQPMPDPLTTANFFRNEVDFGREQIIAFGSGRGRNLKCQFGSVVLHSFAARANGDEDTALDLMSDAIAMFRSYRVTDGIGNDLSFIGSGSGFDQGPTEDGNWFTRGALVVFEYRFIG